MNIVLEHFLAGGSAEHTPVMAEALDVVLDNNTFKPKATRAKTKSEIEQALKKIQVFEEEKRKVSPREELSQDRKELDALWDYIDKIFEKQFNGAVVANQIKDYHERKGWSYRVIHKTLKYYYEIRGNRPKYAEDNTIGIVPYVIRDASKYYKMLAAMKDDESNKKALAIAVVQRKNDVEMTIPVPEYIGIKQKRRSGFSILDEEDVN